MLEAILGWVGTAGSLVAYMLLVRGYLAARSRVYLGMNATAAMLAGTASLIYGAWPSAASNFLWVCMSVYPAVVDMSRGRGAECRAGGARAAICAVSSRSVEAGAATERCAPRMPMPNHNDRGCGAATGLTNLNRSRTG